jgi:hypothetical protein
LVTRSLEDSVAYKKPVNDAVTQADTTGRKAYPPTFHNSAQL